MKGFVRFFVIALVFWLSCQSFSELTITLEEGELIQLSKNFDPDTRQPPRTNPLKGFVPFQNSQSDFPCSMEFFAFPLSEILLDDNVLDFSWFEKQLVDIASRGNQAVCRPYLDYPGEPSGIPQYLIDAGLPVKKYSDHGGGLSPDYSDGRLIRALENFIVKWAELYDGDPRLGFITLGLLGFWGEWHTWPHDDWFAPQAMQQQIIKSYAQAFKTTRLLMRQPHPYAEFTTIGFHDDSFGFSTLPPTDWHFWPQMKAAGLADSWKTRPIGGEVRPEIQETLWKSPQNAPEDYELAVETTHASWLINQAVFEPGFKRWSGSARSRAVQGSQILGYDFFVSQVALEEIKPDEFWLSVEIRNLGVAPFYYKWPLLYCLSSDDKRIAQGELAWDIRRCLPGDHNMITVDFKTNQALAKGNYVLWLKVENPLPSGKPLLFSNKENQKQREGWVPIYSFRVKRAG